MRRTHILIAVISLVLVLSLVYWEWTHGTSPGPLHPSHVTLARLEGSSGCAECHGQGTSPTAMADACNRCHQEIQQQLEQARGLHGKLARAAAPACNNCHSEHGGASMQLVAAQSFKQAGFENPDAFDHAKVTEFRLAGRHAELSCAQCHHKSASPALAEGQKRFLGLAQDCTSCHKDVHQGTYGPDCASCHGQAHPFKQADGFAHTPKFPLEGGHTNLACTKCHENSGPSSVLALHGESFTVRACAVCHKDPHEGALGPDCASCHGTSKPFDQVEEFKHTTAFPLAGGHAGIACKQCHEKTGPYSVASLKLTKQPVRACGVCHISPHSKPMMAMIATSVGKRDAETCGACHQAEHKSFLSPVATMTAQQHVATGFKLEPPHDKAKCVDCHKQMGTRKPLEKGPTLAVQFAAFFPSRSAQSCESCHTDPHRGQFANGPTHGACIACHAPTHFVPGDYDLDAHDKTAFPLTGAHRAIACASCHKKQGAAVQFVATATSCQACHADIHGGRFDQRGMLATVDGRSGCARCHTTASYTKIAWTGPDHATWTGYVLNGAHATASCTACHKPLANPDARGHLWGAAPKACASCHVDVHAGQFARQNVTDCARCHSDKGKFTETSFDHQRDSVFKLDADHMKLACAACHRPTQVAANLTIIRYRPLGTRCEDCHDSRGLGARRAP